MTPDVPMTFLQACAKREGFYVPNSRPARNNNPLDLEFGLEAEAFGALHGDPRFAVFPDLETGWEAGRRWFSIPARFDSVGRLVGGYKGATIRQAILRFAPPVENDSESYVAEVCADAHLMPDAILTDVILDAKVILNAKFT